MARQNGQATFETPVGSVGTSVPLLGDDVSSTNVERIFTAWERMTVVEVGACAEDSTAVPSSAFTYTVSKRTGGVAANDAVIQVWTGPFAAEGGVGGDPSVFNFDAANQIPNGIITNTQGLLTAGKCLRAYCETTLAKGDQIVFKVTATGGSATVVFYAKTYLDGAGLVESSDVDSN